MMQIIKGKSTKQTIHQAPKSNDARMVLKPMVVAMTTIFLGVGMNAVHAGERESLEQLRSTTASLVNLLVEEGVLSKSKAEDLLRQATQEAAKAKEKDAITDAANTQNSGVEKALDEKMVRVQYVPEIVKKEIRDDVKKEVMAKLNYKAGERLGVPDWIDRMHWEGDLRVRYQHDGFPLGNSTPAQFNPANGTNVTNTTEDQNRLRLRARLGVKVAVNDWLSAGISMTTGSQNDPLSPNQTLGANSAKYNFGLDRAYLKAEIKPWLNVVGGRFANPWLSTDLVWDPDLAFDGVATSLTPKINDNWSTFITVGAFPLEQTEVNANSGKPDNKAKSKWIYGSQAGIKWTSPNLSTAKVGLALYDFSNVEGMTNPKDTTYFSGTAPAFKTKGNSYYDLNGANSKNLPGTEVYGLTSKYREVNLTGQVDIASFNPVHVILTGDYVRNIGFDAQEIFTRTGQSAPKKEVNGYQVKLAVGMPTTYQANDWQAFAAYKYLEADAVLDSFTDSDFHLGGTNAKGWIVGASYGIDKNSWLTARWFSADEITPRAGIPPLNIDVLMLDMNAKF